MVAQSPMYRFFVQFCQKLHLNVLIVICIKKKLTVLFLNYKPLKL